MTALRILVVDDEPQILRFLKPSLTAAGYDVITATTGQEALKAAATKAPALMLLDLGLPDIDGKDVIASIRQWSELPIIIISARDQEVEKVAALDLGADDFIEKPFGVPELMARLRSVFRRTARQQGETTRMSIGKLDVDVLAHTVKVEGKPLKLTPKEFDLLALLVRNAGRVITHRQLLTAIWGPSHVENVQYLRVFIGQLRQKLVDAGEPDDLIQTEPGVGYRLRLDSDM